MIELNKSGDSRPPHMFETRAMATQYQLFIQHEDKGYAEQAAMEAFELLQDLEQELSYYISNSHISIFNRTAPGETIRIGEHAWNCIRQSEKVFRMTKGLFDISIGHFKHGMKPRKKFRGHGWVTDPDKNGLILKKEDIQIDLGGIGKGYALDQLVLLLQDWEIDHFLVHGGRSSVVCRGHLNGEVTGWPVSVSLVGDDQEEPIYLVNESMSSSGLIKGDHIIDPATGKGTKELRATWIIGPNAAVTDGLSTALMMMGVSDIKKMVERNAGYQVILRLDKKKKVKYFGFENIPK